MTAVSASMLSKLITHASAVFISPPWLCVRYCRDEPGLSCCQEHEVCVNEEVVIPLAAAVRATQLVARKKDEVRTWGGRGTDSTAVSQLLRCAKPTPAATERDRLRPPTVQHLS